VELGLGFLNRKRHRPGRCPVLLDDRSAFRPGLQRRVKLVARIAVVGGTGLIGTRLVALLLRQGHHAVAASRATGVNAYTGEGLAAALAGMDTVVDVSDSPSVNEEEALDYFQTSTLNLLTYGAAARVGHHVVLSVVNTTRLAAAQGGYFRAKELQEGLVSESAMPYTLVHATQFFEYLHDLADTATRGGDVRLPDVQLQPIAADDVARAIALTAVSAPINRIVEFAGPDRFALRDLVRRELHARRDPREVVADPLATYFGARLGPMDLLPDGTATVMPTRFDDWLAQSTLRPEARRQ
jgi:uncharacterized protein YbjT (DUF2867 family)